MGKLLLHAEKTLFNLYTVTYNSIVNRGKNNKVYTGFVRRMVYSRQPVSGSVRPVVAKESPVAVFVLRNDKPILRHAAINNGKL